MNLSKAQLQMAEGRGDSGGVHARARLNTDWFPGERVMVSRVYPATIIGLDTRFTASYFVRVDATGTTKSIGAVSLFVPENDEDKEIHPTEY